MQAPEIQKMNKNIKKYLPSKKLGFILSASAAAIIILLIITSYFGHTLSFNKKKVLLTGTVGDVIQKDSNSNGIPDWEESLWGLDPKGDGDSNKTIIEQKRKVASLNPDAADTTNLTPGSKTDQLSQEIATAVLALQQSGGLTPQAVANIALSVGAHIDTAHPLVSPYTKKSITSVNDSSESARHAYAQKIQALLNSYNDKGLGTELDIMDQDLQKEDDASLKDLDPIANYYIQFAQDVINQPTPKDAVFYIVPLANSLAALGHSIKDVELLSTDAATGLTGLANYSTALDNFQTASDRLVQYFSS